MSHEAWCAFACCQWEGKKEEEFIEAEPEMMFCCFWLFSELWRGDVSVPDTRRPLECTHIVTRVSLQKAPGSPCHFVEMQLLFHCCISWLGKAPPTRTTACA